MAPGDRKTIEYTLVLPTEYSRGQHRVRLPRLGSEPCAPPHLRSRRPARRDPAGWFAVSRRAARSAGPSCWRTRGRMTAMRSVSCQVAIVGGSAWPRPRQRRAAPSNWRWHPRGRRPWMGALAQMAAGPDRVLMRYRIHAPPGCLAFPPRSAGDPPRRLAIAVRRAAGFVAGRRQRLSVALRDRSGPGADLRPQGDPPVRTFRSRAQAQARLDTFTLPGANGSHLDLALREADRLLARQPPGPRGCCCSPTCAPDRT